MRLKKGQEIAGFPAAAIRSLFQKHGTYITAATAAAELKQPKATGELVVRRLVKAGFLERHPYEKGVWTLSIKGGALTMASTKTITRATADRLMKELLERVRSINAPDSKFLYRVKRIAVYGSYNTDAPVLGDLDITYELEDSPRLAAARSDDGSYVRLCREYIAETGRRCRDFFAVLGWPEQHVTQYLRARSSFINLTDPRTDPIVKRVKAREVYPGASGG